MSSNFYYSGLKEVNVDFTNSSDTSGISSLYNSIKNDLIAAYNNVSLSDKVVGNDTLYSIQIKNADIDVCITMALGLGFGFFPINNNEATVDISSYSYYDLMFEAIKAYGQTDTCLFGSRHSQKVDGVTTKYVTNDCYGYDYQRTSVKLRNFISISDITPISGTLLSIPQGRPYLTNYATDNILGSAYTRKLSLWNVKKNTANSMRTSNFMLPRYCYGRVNYSIMTKSDGTFAIYLYQTRPRKVVPDNYTGTEGFDNHEDWRRFGVMSVMFYDGINNCAGWIMPQAPSPLAQRYNKSRKNNCWAVLAFVNSFYEDTNKRFASVIGSTEYVPYVATKNYSTDILSLSNYPIFNDSSVNDFTVKSIYCDIRGVNKPYTTQIGGDTYISYNNFNIDSNILVYCKACCTICGVYDNPIVSNFRSYKSIIGDPANVRRTKSDDSTVWEWGGSGMLHRVE